MSGRDEGPVWRRLTPRRNFSVPSAVGSIGGEAVRDGAAVLSLIAW
jgi:hypothetical protein